MRVFGFLRRRWTILDIGRCERCRVRGDHRISAHRQGRCGWRSNRRRENPKEVDHGTNSEQREKGNPRVWKRAQQHRYPYRRGRSTVKDETCTEPRNRCQKQCRGEDLDLMWHPENRSGHGKDSARLNNCRPSEQEDDQPQPFRSTLRCVRLENAVASSHFIPPVTTPDPIPQ